MDTRYVRKMLRLEAADGGVIVLEDASEQELLEQLTKILSEEFEIDADSINADANMYEDLGIDSIDAVDLIVRLRELTGKRVPPEDFKTVRTVGDVVQVIRSL
jgi:acyl carrier protein